MLGLKYSLIMRENPVLSSKTKRALKQQAHHLHPIIIIGQQGLTPAVIAETDKSLKAHELLKVKLNQPDKESRKKMAAELCEETGAECLQIIGNIALIYRKNPEE